MLFVVDRAGSPAVLVIVSIIIHDSRKHRVGKKTIIILPVRQKLVRIRIAQAAKKSPVRIEHFCSGAAPSHSEKSGHGLTNFMGRRPGHISRKRPDRHVTDAAVTQPAGGLKEMPFRIIPW